jgi:hypothetical protein
VKVFISWSGEPSRSIAKALTGWLQTVVQHVDAWMSDEEIGSGARWSDAIAASLGETNFGIVCVARANQHAPWLIFEAGALAKSVELARVVPLCIDLSPPEVTGPLSAFQGRQLDRDGVSRLVHDISAASEKPMPAEQMAMVFDAMWPRLEAAVTKAINAVPGDTEPRRAENMLEELVDRIRRIDRQLTEEAGDTRNEAKYAVVFTRDYVNRESFSRRKYKQGTIGFITRIYTDRPLGGISHVDVRIKDELLHKVPSDYFT